MKKFFSILFFLVFLSFAIPVNGQVVYNEVRTVVDTVTPQTLTGAWVDMGNEIPIRGFSKLALWLQVDINSSVNLRIRFKYLIASAGNEYDPVILTPSASDVKIEPEYYELNVDADGNYVFDVGLIGANYVQPQVMAGTAGSPAGKILGAYATLSNR